MFTLAHLSDPHVPSPLSNNPAALFNKRALGYLSWHTRRRRIHRREVLDALTEDLGAQRPDHVAITGDLVNISLPTEFGAAARWLASLGPADGVSVVPGNHDAYVRIPWSRSWSFWADYMTSDEGDRRPPTREGARFPFLRRRDPIALIGLSTAVPTAPGLASGRLGRPQIEAMAEHLRRLGEERRFRVILIHHPPQVGGASRRKGLRDAAAFRRAIAACGAELVLHGHNHRFARTEMEGFHGPVPVLGAPSASALPAEGASGAQYHLCRISVANDGWRVDVEIRRFDAVLFRFVAAETQHLTIARHTPPSLEECLAPTA
jgi:3',5'-cyclic AMP phosphodiesterase CpdA